MKFLNVDLNIESKSSLTGLLSEFDNRVAVLFSDRIKGRHCLYLETNDVAAVSQDAVLNVLCSLVESLSDKGRRIWNGAAKKEFDLGYEARLTRLSPKRVQQITICPKTLRRVADLGATITMTLYYREDSWATD